MYPAWGGGAHTWEAVVGDASSSQGRTPFMHRSAKAFVVQGRFFFCLMIEEKLYHTGTLPLISDDSLRSQSSGILEDAQTRVFLRKRTNFRTELRPT